MEKKKLSLVGLNLKRIMDEQGISGLELSDDQIDEIFDLATPRKT